MWIHPICMVGALSSVLFRQRVYLLRGQRQTERIILVKLPQLLLKLQERNCVELLKKNPMKGLSMRATLIVDLAMKFKWKLSSGILIDEYTMNALESNEKMWDHLLAKNLSKFASKRDGLAVRRHFVFLLLMFVLYLFPKLFLKWYFNCRVIFAALSE